MSQTINDFLAQAIGSQGMRVAPIIKGLKQGNEEIFVDFDAGVPVHELVHRKSALIDQSRPLIEFSCRLTRQQASKLLGAVIPASSVFYRPVLAGF